MTKTRQTRSYFVKNSIFGQNCQKLPELKIWKKTNKQKQKNKKKKKQKEKTPNKNPVPRVMS